jgi:hypothetical protein
MALFSWQCFSPSSKSKERQEGWWQQAFAHSFSELNWKNVSIAAVCHQGKIHRVDPKFTS